MSIKIILPGSLKKWLGGQDETDCDGQTVKECIDNLEKDYPGFKSKIVNDNGELSADILLFVNGTNILNLENLETPLKDGDEIGVIPFAAGG